MKKKIIFKIILTIFSITALIFSCFCIVNCIQHLKIYKNNEIKYMIDLGSFITFQSYRLIFYIFCAISNILLFLVVNLKDLKFLTGSLIKQIKEHRENTATTRKEKKQAKLKAEIEKKQAKLNEMNNQ